MYDDRLSRTRPCGRYSRTGRSVLAIVVVKTHLRERGGNGLRNRSHPVRPAVPATGAASVSGPGGVGRRTPYTRCRGKSRHRAPTDPRPRRIVANSTAKLFQFTAFSSISRRRQSLIIIVIITFIIIVVVVFVVTGTISNNYVRLRPNVDAAWDE